ncbi:hypothetical protein [Streptosporangium saharense]|uniref:Uncharacterized protein n=1 Tax=Streptosporangium saharense TaxID=1706840 RepID=A0A7W7VLM2_9ACTN|nr:hypothetical protein [Streptosporangium saharense]MBB4914310.1 hypothetical protein [Streptosporangium saharense]
MINAEAGRLREPAAWLMIAVASTGVLVGVEQLLFGTSLGGSFAFRAASHVGGLTSPVTTALLVGAVLLAGHAGPALARLRLMTQVAVGTLGLAALFGTVGVFGGLFAGETGLWQKVEFLVVNLPALGLTGLALAYLLPRMAAAGPARKQPPFSHAQPFPGAHPGSQPGVPYPGPHAQEQGPAQVPVQPAAHGMPPHEQGVPPYEQGARPQETAQHGFPVQDQHHAFPQQDQHAFPVQDQHAFPNQDQSAHTFPVQDQSAHGFPVQEQFSAQDQSHGFPGQAQGGHGFPQQAQSAPVSRPAHSQPALPPAPAPAPAPSEGPGDRYGQDLLNPQTGSHTSAPTSYGQQYGTAESYNPGPYVPADVQPPAPSYEPPAYDPSGYGPRTEPQPQAPVSYGEPQVPAYTDPQLPGYPQPAEPQTGGYGQQAGQFHGADSYSADSYKADSYGADSYGGRPEPQAASPYGSESQPRLSFDTQTSFPQPPDNYGQPLTGYSGAEFARQTEPNLHYPAPDPVDPRSQQMAQAYQQAENYQQSQAGTPEPQLRVPEYTSNPHPNQPGGSYDSPLGHPQAQPYQQGGQWENSAAETTMRFDPAAYQADPLNAPGPAPRTWDSQPPIDPTAIYKPERSGQVTGEETQDRERVGPGQEQNMSWYGSDRREH